MEQSFHTLLYRAFHAQRNYLRRFLSDIGLGAGQPKLLDYLAVHGPCMQQQLADYFEIDAAAVSRMVASMQKGGFIVQKTDENSRRRNYIELTEKGRQATVIWEAHYKEIQDIMLQGFSEQEQEQLADYLNRLYQNVRTWKEEHPCKT